MPSGSSNQPKLLKGAFIDSNLSAFPPLVVSFQFNPEKMTRRRTVYVRMPKSRAGREERVPVSESLGEAHSTITSPEILTFDIRLDATDAMEKADPIAGEFGVLPALSALEMMIVPRAESLFAGLLGMSADFGFGKRTSTPVLIFIWGRQRIYPVRLTDLTIQETEYNPFLNPTRVTASVTIQVIAGQNPFFIFTEAQRELLAALNLANSAGLTRSIINIG